MQTQPRPQRQLTPHAAPVRNRQASTLVSNSGPTRLFNNPLNMQTPPRVQRQVVPNAPGRGRPPRIIIPNFDPIRLFTGNGGIPPPGGSPGRNRGGSRKLKKGKKSRKTNKSRK